MSDLTNAPTVLRIESDEVVRLAQELAALRKVSVEDAVAEAVRRQLEREREAQEYIRRVTAAAAEVRAHLLEPLTQASINELLYGPDGLPG